MIIGLSLKEHADYFTLIFFRLYDSKKMPSTKDKCNSYNVNERIIAAAIIIMLNQVNTPACLSEVKVPSNDPRRNL
jgi:hypothetical protein